MPQHSEPTFLMYPPPAWMEQKEWRCDGAHLKYDELCGSFLFIRLHQIYACFRISFFGNSTLPPPPLTHKHTHTPYHLEMNGRLTFRAVSTLRSSFIQISFPPPTSHHALYDASTSLLISSADANEFGRGGRIGRGGVGGIVMDKIPQRDGNIEYLATRTIPEFSSAETKRTHSYSRNIGWEIPPRKKSTFKWDAFISAWPLKREEGSCHSKEGKGHSAMHPLLIFFFSSLPPFLSSPSPTDPHSPLRARIRTRIFTIARWL